jgi:hypothetical protein
LEPIVTNEAKQEKLDMIACLTKTGLLERQISQQELIINLLKDGCTWTEDIYSNKFQDKLTVPKEVEKAALRSLRGYMPEVDYLLDNDGDNRFIWIAAVQINTGK